jgi:hypothetical protein
MLGRLFALRISEALRVPSSCCEIPIRPMTGRAEFHLPRRSPSQDRKRGSSPRETVSASAVNPIVGVNGGSNPRLMNSAIWYRGPASSLKFAAAVQHAAGVSRSFRGATSHRTKLGSYVGGRNARLSRPMRVTATMGTIHCGTTGLWRFARC